MNLEINKNNLFGGKLMAINRNAQTGFHYENTEKKDKNFMYNNLKRANCYNCNFSGSNFDFTCLRGAHFKKCGFIKCSFKNAEFIGSNLKGCKFKNAMFENTVFEGVNLDAADFKDAQFKNVIFVGTDVTKARNLNTNNPEIKIYDEMPELEISDDLKAAVETAMENKYVKASRVFDTKDGSINTITMMTLLEKFDEKKLIRALNKLAEEVDRDFYTVSYIVKRIKMQ